MFTVTDAAVNVLKEYLLHNKIHSPIRITLMHGCCKEKTLHFTVGTSRANDLIFTFDGITFLIDRNLAIRCGAITINFEEKYECCPCSGHNGGLMINSENFPYYCCCPTCTEICGAVCEKGEDRVPAH